MSEIHSKYPLNHEVFRGGRYLEAFACLDDIDHWELSILQYLGNKMPFNKGFVGEKAFPSVATISHNTKIPQSTVRKKINSLVKKGYLIKNEKRFLNERGHWEQSSNDYILTNLTFDLFEGVIHSRNYIAAERKRAVGQSEVHYPTPFTEDSPPPKPDEAGEVLIEEAPVSLVATNSQAKSQEEDPNLTPNSSYDPSLISRQKSEVDRIIVNWEEVVKRTVSIFEKRRFLQDYIRTRSCEISLLEKILKIEEDPYLLERAKSVNWLFKGFDVALRNKDEILKLGSSALDSVSSVDDLQQIESQLPDLIKKNSHNFVSPSKVIVESLFGESKRKAQKRINVEDHSSPMPKNSQELKTAIEVKLKGNSPAKLKSRLRDIEKLIPTCSFAQLLDLYLKYSEEA